MSAKKKRNKDKIVIGSKIEVETNNNTKPKCYNNKEKYCRKELCGKWYESCKSK